MEKEVDNCHRAMLEELQRCASYIRSRGAESCSPFNLGGSSVD